MKLFDWMFKKTTERQKIEEEAEQKVLLLFREVEALIEVYYEQLLKGKVYDEDVCKDLRDLYISRLKREYILHRDYPKTSPPYNNIDEVFNRIIFKVNEAVSKILN